MKATEYYSPVVLFILLCKMALTFESVDEILKCDESHLVYGDKFHHMDKTNSKTSSTLCRMINSTTGSQEGTQAGWDFKTFDSN